MEGEHSHEHTTRSLQSSMQVENDEEQVDESSTISLKGKRSRAATRVPGDMQTLSQPGDTDGEQATGDMSRFAGAAGLAVILNQLTGYFSGRARVDDLDILSFCLNHLFSKIDFLYREALLTLPGQPGPIPMESSSFAESLGRQEAWTQLRAIQHVSQRIESLCRLLNDATASILNTLDTSTSQQPSLPTPGREWLQALKQERWDLAMAALNSSLHGWHTDVAQYSHFTERFALIAADASSLLELEQSFQLILVSAVALFGEIVPDFAAVSSGDDEGAAMLLFDLMQQADQLLSACSAILALLPSLIERSAVKLKLS